jgi:hypothetical protein
MHVVQCTGVHVLVAVFSVVHLDMCSCELVFGLAVQDSNIDDCNYLALHRDTLPLHARLRMQARLLMQASCVVISSQLIGAFRQS